MFCYVNIKETFPFIILQTTWERYFLNVLKQAVTFKKMNIQLKQFMHHSWNMFFNNIIKDRKTE